MSGAIGSGSDGPEVKVWRVGNEGIKPLHTLTGHSLGVVSVDVSPNGKCEQKNSKVSNIFTVLIEFQILPAVRWIQRFACGMLRVENC